MQKTIKDEYCIYKITNTINGKSYIGQHKVKKEAPRQYMGKGLGIQQAFKEYGRGKFTKEILEIVEDDKSRRVVSEREKYWIKKMNTMEPNGYNRNPGGIGGCTKESAAKVVSTKRKNGYHHSDKTKNKMSQAALGRIFSDEHKRHLSEHHHLKTKRIIVFEDGEREITTDSINTIAKKYNTSPNTLLRNSAKKKFINGVYLDNISADNYACCKNTSPLDMASCKDPIIGDICSYRNLKHRMWRHKDRYVNINIKDCILKEE